MKTTLAEEHAQRLKNAHDRAPRGSTEAYLTKVDLLLYVEAKGLDRATYGLKPKTVGRV